ncbi:MAG: energy-coupling factor ABC transporter permease [Treponema sp.]|nr:energy-coupling factor ABC transporter permease [Treponema sp.]
MADALLAPAVAGVMYGATAVTAGISIHKIKKENDSHKIPMMAVCAALVFAGQMINYTIPGTGSSGHLCGGFLLSAILGPFAGFISMMIILAIQGLFFADGGLMALGANCWNMAFYGCFLGYYAFWRPLMKKPGRVKIILASVLGCIVTLQLGAFSVVLETSLSGITEIPFGTFCGLMQPIHLAIGLIEGIITAAVLVFIYEARPESLSLPKTEGKDELQGKLSFRATLIVLAATALVTAGGFSLLASSHPDGLEWSLFGNAEEGYAENLSLDEDNFGYSSDAADIAASVQDHTSFLPDYNLPESESAAGTSLAGIVGSVIVAAFAVAVSMLIKIFKKKEKAEA